MGIDEETLFRVIIDMYAEAKIQVHECTSENYEISSKLKAAEYGIKNQTNRISELNLEIQELKEKLKE